MPKRFTLPNKSNLQGWPRERRGRTVLLSGGMADGDSNGTTHRCVHRMRASVCAVCSPVAAQTPGDEITARPWRAYVRCHGVEGLTCFCKVSAKDLYYLRPWCTQLTRRPSFCTPLRVSWRPQSGSVGRTSQWASLHRPLLRSSPSNLHHAGVCWCKVKPTGWYIHSKLYIYSFNTPVSNRPHQRVKK